jgi:hypothetical protein
VTDKQLPVEVLEDVAKKLQEQYSTLVKCQLFFLQRFMAEKQIEVLEDVE